MHGVEWGKSKAYLSLSPHLKKEHYKIFETANQIRPEGHVLMVASITPMISGSVSKTVNLPSYATVEDVKNINILAYESGVKAIAIYRDGCKTMQPLSTGQAVQEGKARLEDLSYSELLEYAKNERGANPERKRPEGIRASHTHSAKIGDIELYITVGFYSNGDMAEIFVSTDKDGTVVKGLLANISKAVSHMLQYGISPQNISKMMRGQKYEPSGLVERHPYIKMASSISDLISKVIDIECNDFSRCQVKPDEADQSPIMAQMMFINEVPDVEDDDNFERIYGEICSNCGSDNLMRNGTCKVCIDCGTTTGCS